MTTEAPVLEPVLHNKRSCCNEKPIHYNLRVKPLLTATREYPRAATKTQHSQKTFAFLELRETDNKRIRKLI